MGVLDFLTGGKSTESTQTQEPAPRDTDQSMMWEEFMMQVFGADKLIEAKSQELAELEANEPSNWGDIPKWLAELSKLKKEIDEMQPGETSSGGMPGDAITEATAGMSGDAITEATAGMSLLAKMQENATRKAEADLMLGAAAQTESQAYVDALSQGVNAFKAANAAYGAKAGGITNKYRQNINPMINSLRPTATRAPVTLQLGDFQTPFYTGSQRYAQNQYGDLTDSLRESDLAQSALTNLLARSDVGADAGFATNRLNQNLSTANLLNEIANANLPFTSDINYLTQYLTGQANLGEGLRYQMPTVTGSTSSDMGFLGTVGQAVDIIG